MVCVGHATHGRTSVYEYRRAVLYQVTVYFYVEDETMHISEVKSENSGMAQGAFLQRKPVLRVGPDNSGL